MTAKGPITQGAVHCLLTHQDHAVEVVESIIKEMNMDFYAEQLMEELGASSLFDLARVCSFPQTSSHFFSFADGLFCHQALVRMKVLQDRCIASERVIRRLHKHHDI